MFCCLFTFSFDLLLFLPRNWSKLFQNSQMRVDYFFKVSGNSVCFQNKLVNKHKNLAQNSQFSKKWHQIPKSVFEKVNFISQWKVFKPCGELLYKLDFSGDLYHLWQKKVRNYFHFSVLIMNYHVLHVKVLRNWLEG